MSKHSALTGLAPVLLVVAGAIRAPMPAGDLPTTAVCIVGNARTLPKPAVYKSLERFVNGLNATGLVQQQHADAFAFVTLEGAPPKGQTGWNWVAVDVSKEEAMTALRPINPVKVVLEPKSDEVTWNNIDKYVRNREACFTNGYWLKTPEGLRRSANQIVHWQRCLDLVVEQEQKVGRKYSVVIITRPDLAYNRNGLDLKPVAEGRFMSQRDWVMVMPRQIAGLLLKKDRARPLSCEKGEPCCGKVGQSEVLWEFLMGVRPDNRGSCQCGPSAAETGPLSQQTGIFLATIARPERSGP
mmetsp:Transcript_107330/g.313849  ORF Transcript_107330/g.313849 Transcript_107330/m.313849 type:complete len:298 (+) Transcript_107330:69-962(+)